MSYFGRQSSLDSCQSWRHARDYVTRVKDSRLVELELPTGAAPDRDIALGGSPFPPIADYGLLSDCEVCALVAPGGNVEWMSLPQMDGPSVFSAILDRHAGRFRAGPVDRTVPAGRRYLPGTMILETTWGTPSGWLEVLDLLVIGPWRHDDERSHRYVRAPRDRAAEQVLLRVFRCLDGFVDLEIDCEPPFDYGRAKGRGGTSGSVRGRCVRGRRTRLSLRLRHRDLAWDSRDSEHARNEQARRPSAFCASLGATMRRRDLTRPTPGSLRRGDTGMS